MPTLTTITLYPFAQGDGELQDPDVNDSPVLVGGGSVSDDSDESYVEQGAWEAAEGSTSHVEPLATYFRTPAGFDPQFLLIQARLRNNAYLYAHPPAGARDFYTELKSVDGSTRYDVEIISGAPPILAPIVGINPDPGVPDFTWFTWWAQATSVDPDNPGTDGGWYRLDWDYDRDPGDKAALMGDGLRLDMGMFFSPTAAEDDDIRYPWIDWAEVRLLVAGVPIGSLAPPCHLYPRDDDQGVGSGAIWPPPSSGRPGSYY